MEKETEKTQSGTGITFYIVSFLLFFSDQLILYIIGSTTMVGNLNLGIQYLKIKKLRYPFCKKKYFFLNFVYRFLF